MVGRLDVVCVWDACYGSHRRWKLDLFCEFNSLAFKQILWFFLWSLLKNIYFQNTSFLHNIWFDNEHANNSQPITKSYRLPRECVSQLNAALKKKKCQMNEASCHSSQLHANRSKLIKHRNFLLTFCSSYFIILIFFLECSRSELASSDFKKSI